MIIMIHELREPERWELINLPNVRKNYYFISNYGTLKNIKGKILSVYLDKDGYLKCTLYDDKGERHHFMCHRLVAMVYIPNPENKPEVNHLKPSDKADLYYKNLEWVTHEENLKHSLDNHLQDFLTCEDHGRATLTNDEVERICQLMEKGFTNKEIIREFGKTEKQEKEKLRGVLKHIRSRKTWKSISEKYNF